MEAERLDMDRLGASDGVAYLTQWVRERYLDVQVTQVGRSLSEFFRKLKKKAGQSMRDYIGEFDRAHARLVECGCTLPDLAAAWVFVDRMGLEEASELNLLASVGNVYDLQLLQKAAVIQDRALRKPWEQGSGVRTDKGNRKEWGGHRKPYYSARCRRPGPQRPGGPRGTLRGLCHPRDREAETVTVYVLGKRCRGHEAGGRRSPLGSESQILLCRLSTERALAQGCLLSSEPAWSQGDGQWVEHYYDYFLDYHYEPRQ